MNPRFIKDRISLRLMFIVAAGFNLIFAAFVIILSVKSSGLFQTQSVFSVITGTEWQPSSGNFGLRYFILGTLLVTFMSIIIAAPVSVLVSVFLAEYAPKKMAAAAKSMTDILAGIPSVIYGIWGVFFVVPAVAKTAKLVFNMDVSGYSLISASIVLSIMVFPVMTNIITELIEAQPLEMREAALSIGATKWQTVKHAVLRKIYPGIIASVILGLSRAFGETMAVMMVAGNVAMLPQKLTDPVYTLSSLIANNYGEMMSIPLYDNSLMFVSLILLVVVFMFNSAAQLILRKFTRKYN